MTYRAPEFVVPPDRPFKHDVLGREPIVSFVAGILAKAGGPFVMALDAPWGSGKTTFVRMLQATLSRNNFVCVYFNAWQVDYVTDPLVALVAAIEQIELPSSGASEKLREGLKTVRKVAGWVAKRGAKAAAKAVTMGALDVDKEMEEIAAEFAGGLAGDVVGAFQQEKQLLARFRAELEGAIGRLPAAGKQPTLIFIVDELDRCRPTFAIELLERIKHLFDVQNIAFLLALDKRQLEAITANVYGERIDAPEYLRRFIDLEYSMPLPDMRAFTTALLDGFGMHTWFTGRTHQETRHDRDNFIEFFTVLADMFGLSLRARERCITRLQVVLDQTGESQALDPALVALLVVLRSKEPDLFRSYCAGRASPSEVMETLTSLPGGASFCDDHLGRILEAHLIAADPNRERAKQRNADLERVSKDRGAPEKEREHAAALVDLRRYIPGFRRREISLKHLAAKIDLASHVNQ
ncbi:MAG: KAP family NTPase [Burkholderiaceae bacterium]|nr:KAP family NTPase [Burkholderiaceae bacterium]